MGRTRPRAKPQQQDPQGLGAIAGALTAGAGVAFVADTLLRLHGPDVIKAGATNSANAAAFVARLGLTAPVLAPDPSPALRPGNVSGGQNRFSVARGQGKVDELFNRARYVGAAFRRGLDAYREGGINAWRKRERAWHALHVQAQRNRQAARGRCDVAAAAYGVILGWSGIDDRSTTSDCREMFGKNFDVTRPPARGLPGTVHAFCRCVPVAPYPNAEVIY